MENQTVGEQHCAQRVQVVGQRGWRKLPYRGTGAPVHQCADADENNWGKDM